MQLTSMTMELATELMNWWISSSDSRMDTLKNPDFLYNLMFQDQGRSKLYLIKGLLFVVTSIVPEDSAVVLELGLNSKAYDTKEAKSELIQIVRDYKLNRLTFAHPAPITVLAPVLKEIGFKYEGRMRYACVYNGKLADMDLFGFYSVKPEKKRRRRGRRNAKQKGAFTQTNGSGITLGEQDVIYGEETRS